MVVVAVGDDPAVVDRDYALTEGFDQLMLVGDHQHGGAALVDLGEKLDDLVAHLRVDIARRLVRDNQSGVVDQRSRQRNTLLLAAGKLGGMVVCLVAESYQLEDVRNALFDGIVLFADTAHREGDVLIDRHLGDQTEILENDAHRAPEIRHLAAAHVLEVHVVDDDRAGGGLFLAHNQLEEGAFARAGSADDKDELTLVDFEGYMIQRVNAVRLIYLGYVFEFNHSNAFR